MPLSSAANWGQISASATTHGCYVAFGHNERVVTPMRRWFDRQKFLTTPSGILVNPSYFIRRGLHKALRQHACRMHGSVLDFGCGSKPYRSLFSAADRYVGVDLEVSGHDHGTSVVDVFYDGKTLPFEAATFDHVVALEVFEHVFNLIEILAELRRVMKPGGSLLISSPFAWPEHEQPYDFARYTSFGIVHILEHAGFEIQSVDKTTSDVRAMGQLAVNYVGDMLVPRLGFAGKILRAVATIPLNLVIALVDVVLPAPGHLYGGLVVRARTF